MKGQDRGVSVLPRMLSESHPVFLLTGYTDCRKGIQGLQDIVEIDFKKDMKDGGSFIFCGRRCDRVKILRYERGSMILAAIRLETARVQWPRKEGELWEIAPSQAGHLLAGGRLTETDILSRVKSCLYDGE